MSDYFTPAAPRESRLTRVAGVSINTLNARLRPRLVFYAQTPVYAPRAVCREPDGGISNHTEEKIYFRFVSASHDGRIGILAR